ncbi:hypothetical protein, partial [Streptococcus cristatus]
QLYQYITYPSPCQHFFKTFLSFLQFYFPPPTKSLINQQLKGKGYLFLPLPYSLYHRAAKVY